LDSAADSGGGKRMRTKRERLSPEERGVVRAFERDDNAKSVCVV
jgi:hypothetical protein